MPKINYLKFKNELNNLGKSYFTLAELKKFYSQQNSSLCPLLSHWVKGGLIFSLGRGYYTFNLAQVDYLQLASNLIRPSYVSFEYALHYYGLINQVSQSITLASQGRHKFVAMGNCIFEYTHLKTELFFGYTLAKGFYLAEAEKAWLDLVYLISRGKRLVDLDSLNKKKFNQRKIKEYLTKFPAYVKYKVAEI